MKNPTIHSLSLKEIRDEISMHLNEKITIQESNKQGKILSEFTGEIIELYDSVFIILAHKGGYNFKKSFNYIDFVTHELNYTFV